MRSTSALLIVGGILIGWGPAVRTVGAGPTRIETEGTLVSLPAGKGRRVGIKNDEGTTWLAKPNEDAGPIARNAFHRLRVLPAGAYVKVEGVLLSTDPLKIGPEHLKSGGTGELLTLDVSKDGKAATPNGRPVRVHRLGSHPTNPVKEELDRRYEVRSDEQTAKQALWDQAKGRQVEIEGFTFRDREGRPTDVFLDRVRGTVPKRTHVTGYPLRKDGKPPTVSFTVPAGAPVWVSKVEGDYARVTYVTHDGRGNSTSQGGWLKRSELQLGRPKSAAKVDGDKKGAAKSLEVLGE